MRKATIFTFLILWSFFSYGQDNKSITVKKGTTLLDHFTPSERYLYPNFTTGKVMFNAKTYTGIKLNYNYLSGEVEFLKSPDTLAINDKKDLKSVIISDDTLFYDNGYILVIKSSHPKIGLKESIEFRDYKNNDGIGTASSAGAVTNYSSLPSQGQVQKLSADQDLVFQRTKVFYIFSTKDEIYLFTKKNVLKLYPKYKDEIKSFLKSTNTKFDDEEDIRLLVEFLEAL